MARAPAYARWWTAATAGQPATPQPIGGKGHIPAAYIRRALDEHISNRKPIAGQLRVTGYEITGDLRLETLTVGLSLFFEYCRFKGDVFVWRMQKLQTLSFSNSVFERGVDARGSQMDGNFLCRMTEFKGPVLARDMRIGSTADFSGAKVFCEAGTGSTIDGEGLGLSRTAANALYWRRAGFNDTARLVLRDVKVASFVHDIGATGWADGWPKTGKLVLDGFTYDRLDDCDAKDTLRWLALQPPKPVVTSAYATLARGFLKLHKRHEAEVILAELKRREVASMQNGARKVAFTVVYAAIGYGQRPSRALLIFAALFLIHWGAVNALSDQRMFAPAVDKTAFEACLEGPGKDCGKTLQSWKTIKSEGKTYRVPARYPDLNPLEFSIESFLPMIQFNQRAYWDVDEPVLRFLLNTLAALGLFLGGLFVGSISGLLTPKLPSE
jgi:hypothetical protein